MQKYHEECWYCGSRNMELKEGYWQCGDCGATYDEPVILRPAEVQPTVVTVPLGKKDVRVHTYELTPYAKRRAAKTRELK